MFLKFAINNQSETVLENFMEACERFRVPTRIHGTKNVVEARAMLEIKGRETNPALTRRLVHKEMIERLWVDLGDHVIRYFREVFHHLRSLCNLDALNELRLFFFHFVFLPRISRMLAELVTA